MITLRGLDKVYPATEAGIAGISTKFIPGEWVTLLGASGSGKTTLLKLIAGLEDKSGGTLENSYLAAETSFVFQEPALLPWKSVIGNVTLPLMLRGMSEPLANEKAAPWLEKLGLTPFQNVKPHELSGGLRMRVSLARAMVTEPKLLLLDEPFAALDEPIRIELGILLRNLFLQTKPTVILVTHSITEGLWLADRALILRGRPGTISWDEKINLGDERPLKTPGRARIFAKSRSVLRAFKAE